MKVLVLGGTRFVGKALVKKLSGLGHEIFLFTRGNNPLPPNVHHLKGDRKISDDLKCLSGMRFDVIVDSSGRSLQDTQQVIAHTGVPNHRLLYVGSAGVYSESKLFPISEEFPIDDQSRHHGKAETEQWLKDSNIPFTSFRPTYIYGPGNYNPIESWFFSRILNNLTIPMPGDGLYITQLGHVDDLADAMSRSLECDCARDNIYNCSSINGITIFGLIEIAAEVCGKNINEISIRSFDPRKIEPKARKAFPLRIGHFVTDISKIQQDLSWHPKYDLKSGLLDSYENDYLLNPVSEPDLTRDIQLFNP